MWYYYFYNDVKKTIDDIIDNLVYVAKIPTRFSNKIKIKYNKINL